MTADEAVREAWEAQPDIDDPALKRYTAAVEWRALEGAPMTNLADEIEALCPHRAHHEEGLEPSCDCYDLRSKIACEWIGHDLARRVGEMEAKSTFLAKEIIGLRVHAEGMIDD